MFLIRLKKRNKVKHVYTILLVLFAWSVSLVAQPPGGNKPTPSGQERVKVLKVAFITEALNLTQEEAQLFWPIYNEYQDKRDVVRARLAENRKKVKEQAETLTPEELLKLADEEMALRQQDLDLQKEMHEKLKKVLPAKKLALLYVAEEDFKKELLEMLKKDDPGKDAPKPNPGDGPKPKPR
jgi:hypothetical protein